MRAVLVRGANPLQRFGWCVHNPVTTNVHETRCWNTDKFLVWLVCYSAEVRGAAPVPLPCRPAPPRAMAAEAMPVGRAARCPGPGGSRRTAVPMVSIVSHSSSRLPANERGRVRAGIGLGWERGRRGVLRGPGLEKHEGEEKELSAPRRAPSI